MKNIRLMGATALQSAIVFGAFGFAQAAFAQDAGTTPAVTAQVETDAAEAVDPCIANPTGEGCGTITVTGSRIRRPNLESTVPVTSIAGESLFQQGDTNIGDTLNELPQLRSTFSQGNPGLGIGIAGLNLLDLRGLGTARTLTLVNGRRHVAADITNNAVSPDVNSIPNDLIERVDIVTGGNSAIYGSDAIAGVVNFVLRRDYEGVQVRGQAGISPRGFGANQYISGMFGQNFADGRGNITLHGEFANQDRYFGSDLPWLKSVNGQLVTDVDPAGLPNGSDGFPDATFLRDVRSATISRFGLVPITQRATTPACGTGLAQTNGPGSSIPTPGLPASAAGSPYNCNFLFDAPGTLAAQTGTRVGVGPFGSFLGGNGQTGREDELLSMAPDLQRYNFNLLAHFTVSEAFEPFVEAKFNRTNTLGNNASPTGIQGTMGQFDARERVRLDNPFLSPAERTTIANAILTSGCNTDLTTACGTRASVFGTGLGRAGALNAADQAAIAAGTYRFVIARTLLDAGIRDEKMERDTFRVVGGVRGGFNEDWNYEVSLNYGKFKEDKTTFGFIDRQRFGLAMDAGINPATGQIQCRSQFDPTAAVAFDRNGAQVNAPTATNPNPSRGNAGQLARLAADIAACQPYNPFGASDNKAATDYFSINAKTSASLRQFVANGFVGGDSSQLFELPGGPVRFALGAEYRKEQGDYIDDPFTSAGDPLANDPNTVNPITQTNSNAVVIGRFNPDAFEVKEAFGEIQFPILKDIPFFSELTVSGAGRVSKYNEVAGDVGTVWTYNAGVDWAPVRDVRFRANYSKAVRAPNLSELYFPPVPNFAPGFTDPCASNVRANNPNRAANCAADLTPAQLASIRTAGISLPVISGSNPNLAEESSKSLTIGAVVQPRIVPGLSFSLDYYKIKVENVIVSLSAQTIANNCYDQPSLGNVFCSLFERNRGAGPDGFGQQVGEILGNSLLQAGVNFAARRREGIDLNANYRGNLGDFAKINTNLIYTHNLKISNYENPALPDFENRVLSELGDPKNEFRWDTDLTRGAFTFGYKMRYIGKMYTSLYENFQELDTACSGTPAINCGPNNLDATEPRQFDATFYHDIRFEWEMKKFAGLGRQANFYAGMDNVLDTHPPLGLSGTGTTGITDRGTGNAAIYDAKGRFLYAGFKFQF